MVVVCYEGRPILANHQYNIRKKIYLFLSMWHWYGQVRKAMAVQDAECDQRKEVQAKDLVHVM